MEFEWDLRKEAENISKHGVSFITAIETFMIPLDLRSRISNIPARNPGITGLVKLKRDVY